jgi:hypothetical protein
MYPFFNGHISPVASDYLAGLKSKAAHPLTPSTPRTAIGSISVTTLLTYRFLRLVFLAVDCCIQVVWGGMFVALMFGSACLG